MEFVISSPGKVIICGEHSVVYGKAAIASSVALRTYLRVCPRTDGQVVVKLPDIDLHGSWSVSELQQFAEEQPDIKNPPEVSKPVESGFRDRLVSKAQAEGNSKGLAKIAFLYLYMALNKKENNQGLEAFVTSELPIGAGLGSSASFSSCLATALLLWHGHYKMQDLEDLSTRQAFTNQVNHWAFRAEKLIHGNPSGIDNSVSTYGGAIRYVTGQMHNLKSFPPLNFVLTNTKVPRNTMDLVSGVRSRKERYPKVFEPLLESMNEISESFNGILNQLSTVSPQEVKEKVEIIQSIEELISLNHNLLNAIGVGHASLDEICKITKKHGLSSKLTGAGGGGCALTFVKPGTPKETLDKVIEELEKNGFACYQTSIGVSGVSIHQEMGSHVPAEAPLNLADFKKLDFKWVLNS